MLLLTQILRSQLVSYTCKYNLLPTASDSRDTATAESEFMKAKKQSFCRHVISYVAVVILSDNDDKSSPINGDTLAIYRRENRR